MPEMPEVETIRRDLAFNILNQPVASVNILNSKTAKNSAAFFSSSLIKKKFVSINRRGKLLYLEISGRPQNFLLVHLKMTGQLIYLSKKIKVVGGHSFNSGSLAKSVGGELPNKQTRVYFEFKNGSRLYFNDLRKFGYLKIVDRLTLGKILINNYGLEPLTPEFTTANLVKVFKNKKTKLKALLLNQKIIAGLGNIYVDETLYAARLHPERLAGTLKLGEIKKLREAINSIIKKAIIHRGTTFNNYVDSRGQKGNFSDFLKVYGRSGKSCRNCGQKLLKKKIVGRGTHYCPNCQK